jgi:hypothetical protein
MSSSGRARRWLHEFVGRIAPLADASTGPAVVVPVVHRRNWLRAALVAARPPAALVAARPRQWIKNALSYTVVWRAC